MVCRTKDVVEFFPTLCSTAIILSLLTSCSTQSATKENVPTSDNPPGTEEYVAPTPDLPIKDVAPDFTYAIWDAYGKICILAKLSASFRITYSSTSGEQNVSVNLPEDARAKGRCGTFDKEPILELSWPGFILIMTFSVVNPKEKQDSWALFSIELLYNTATPISEIASNVGRKSARNLEDGLFTTQYGKSYFCPSPDVINMYNSNRDRVVLARMKDVRLQVYDVNSGKFSPFQRCRLIRMGSIPEPLAENESVLIAVGSTLAVVSVLIVLRYALFRNMAVKKTDYDTTE